ncbi:MAG TPA: orotidine-5'-phosphate decarboxylase [bacterium]|nr:orotidine-5'-phosphate decarboxylase [bacterium]HPN45819.1 orotidine-5'-phosphate decarboxylase [bacterium]
MTFQEKLLQTIADKNSLLCVGLDTDPQKIPAILKNEADPIFAFNKQIIDATADFAAAFKVNIAFYEALGISGWQSLQKTMNYLPGKVIKILDAKRGDIGNTAQMYARAAFEELKADAVTVNAYMGKDSAEPFLQNPEKGVFFLCLTSNPGAQDFQYFSNGKMKLYEYIAKTINDWNTRGNCALVVGATHPEELRDLRALVPDLPFLIPGIGAQGGDLDLAVQYGTNKAGANALYNSSRAIIYAAADEQFAVKAAIAAQTTRDALNRARKGKLL